MAYFAKSTYSLPSIEGDLSHCIALFEAFFKLLCYGCFSSELDWCGRGKCHPYQPFCQLPAQPASLQRLSGHGDGL